MSDDDFEIDDETREEDSAIERNSEEDSETEVELDAEYYDAPPPQEEESSDSQVAVTPPGDEADAKQGGGCLGAILAVAALSLGMLVLWVINA